jgi:hypothetical protein
MGHPWFVVERSSGWLRVVVSHPVARNHPIDEDLSMGHGWVVRVEISPSRPSGAWTEAPAYVFGQEKARRFWRRRACVFLVDLSMADSEGNLAIFFDLYVVDISYSYKLFFEKGLDKFSTGTCGAVTAASPPFATGVGVVGVSLATERSREVEFGDQNS